MLLCQGLPFDVGLRRFADVLDLLDISFSKKRLRRICEDFAYAITVLGRDISDQLIARLADIRAASSLEELASLCPVVNSEDGSAFSIPLRGNAKIRFRASHVRDPDISRKPDGISWITRIMIFEIGAD